MNLVKNSFVASGLLALIIAAPLRAADDDERLLAGLRQRQLFALANAFCLERLQDPRLTEAQRAKLVIEGMLTASQQAIYAPPAERSRHWEAAQQLAEQIGVAHPYRQVVELQKGLLTLAQGELARQEAAGDYKSSIELLRKAGEELAALGKQIQQQGDTPPPGGLSHEEWLALQHDVPWQLARAQRELALCYPADSSEREALLKAANTGLQQLRVQLRDDDPLSWRVKLDLASGTRLLGEEATATRMFTTLVDSPEAPRSVQEQARAELARIQLQAGQLLAAYNLLMAGRASATEPASAELEYALLETRVAQWQAALAEKDAANAERFRDDATQQLALLERAFGPYWSRRGEMLVRSVTGAGANWQFQARSAEARFEKGHFDDETLKLFDQAADAALAAKDFATYLKLASRAANVQERRDNLPAAAARSWKAATNVAERVSQKDPLYARASEVHLQGLKLAAPSAAPEGMQLKYQEHLRLWPRAKSAGEVRFLIGSAAERAGDFRNALEAYQQVPGTHELAPEAMRRAAALWPRYLATLAENPKERLAEYERALAYFRAIVGEPTPPMYSDAQRTAALAIARLLLQDSLAAAPAAQQAIEAAQQGSMLATAAWENEAQSLLVMALAAQPKQREEAARLLAKVANEEPRRLLELLSTLHDSPVNRSPELRRELAKLELTALTLLKPKQSLLSTTQRGTLALLEAAALAAAGEREASLVAYAALLKSQPRSAPVLEGYATVLAESGDRAALQQAREQWQLVTQASPPQSERWWRAKYQVALLSHRLGENAVAAKLIRDLDATPGLKGSPLESEFEALRKKAQ